MVEKRKLSNRILGSIFFSVVLFISGISAFAQQTKILTAEKHNEYGLIYTLPVTSFEVKVVVEKKTFKAGPYYKYAKKYAATDNVVSQDDESWTIKEIHVKPFGIPDDENKYLMQLKAGALTYLEVDKDGMLLAINTKVDPTSDDWSFVPVYNGMDLDDDEYLKYVGEDFVAAISSAKRAQLLGEELLEIRDAKLSLTRGTADTMPTDGRQLELMLQSLERQENAIMAAFVGNVTSETMERVFTFTPDSDGRTVLFRMSDFIGPVEADDYSGDPVYVDVKVVSKGELPVDSKGEEKKMPKDGVAYCIPGVAELTLTLKGEVLYQKLHELSQLGVVFGLSPSVFTDKKEPSFAIFDPSTGALKELGSVKD